MSKNLGVYTALKSAVTSFIIQYGGGLITANVKEKEAFSYVNDDVR